MKILPCFWTQPLFLFLLFCLLCLHCDSLYLIQETPACPTGEIYSQSEFICVPAQPIDSDSGLPPDSCHFGAIAGIACHKETGQRLAGASITAAVDPNCAGSPIMTTVSDADGNFILLKMPVGEVTVEVFSEEIHQTYLVTVKAGEATMIADTECATE